MRKSTKRRSKDKRLWIHTVTTVSTAPPRGLFAKDARTIARTLASRRVSPKGITSGLRMLLFFINRAGRGLSGKRRAELLRAKHLMQEMVAGQRAERPRAEASAVDEAVFRERAYRREAPRGR